MRERARGQHVQEVQTAQRADGQVQLAAPEAPELGDPKHGCWKLGNAEKGSTTVF